jgi:hypothetical protein
LFDCEAIITEKENVGSAVGVAAGRSEGLFITNNLSLCSAATSTTLLTFSFFCNNEINDQTIDCILF